MRRTVKIIFGFLCILAVGIVGVLVGNHYEWFSEATTSAAQSLQR